MGFPIGERDDFQFVPIVISSLFQSLFARRSHVGSEVQSGLEALTGLAIVICHSVCIVEIISNEGHRFQTTNHVHSICLQFLVLGCTHCAIQVLRMSLHRSGKA